MTIEKFLYMAYSASYIFASFCTGIFLSSYIGMAAGMVIELLPRVYMYVCMAWHGDVMMITTSERCWCVARNV